MILAFLQNFLGSILDSSPYIECGLNVLVLCSTLRHFALGAAIFILLSPKINIEFDLM